MKRLVVLVLLVVAGCAIQSTDRMNTVQGDYDKVIWRYCKLKYPTNGYNSCIQHMNDGYLTNEEINYINKSTKWWCEREGP